MPLWRDACARTGAMVMSENEYLNATACPISGVETAGMIIPVVIDGDGTSIYEARDLMRWLNEKHTSPTSRRAIDFRHHGLVVVQHGDSETCQHRAETCENYLKDMGIEPSTSYHPNKFNATQQQRPHSPPQHLLQPQPNSQPRQRQHENNDALRASTFMDAPRTLTFMDVPVQMKPFIVSWPMHLDDHWGLMHIGNVFVYFWKTFQFPDGHILNACFVHHNLGGVEYTNSHGPHVLVHFRN